VADAEPSGIVTGGRCHGLVSVEIGNGDFDLDLRHGGGALELLQPPNGSRLSCGADQKISQIEDYHSRAAAPASRAC